jgi:hypothetical protein
MINRLHRSATASLFALAFLLIASCMARAESETFYTTIRFKPSRLPSFYLKFQGNRLWIADKFEGLSAAKPIVAKGTQHSGSGQGLYSLYEFPKAVLPAKPGNDSEVSALFRVHIHPGQDPDRPHQQVTQAYISSTFYITKKDSQGTRWTYVFNPGLSLTEGQGVAQSPGFEIPDIGRIELSIVTKVQGRQVGIALEAKADGVRIGEVLKNDQEVACQIEVRSESGRTVVSEKGGLDKFGFT